MKLINLLSISIGVALSGLASADESSSTESQLNQVGSLSANIDMVIPSLSIPASLNTAGIVAKRPLDGLCDTETTEETDTTDTTTEATDTEEATVITDTDIFLDYISALGSSRNLWAGFEYYGVGPDGEALWKLATYGANSYHNWWAGNERGEEQGTHGSGLGDCPSGQVVVGVRYYEGGSADWTASVNQDWVDGIGVHCQSLSDGSELFFNWSDEDADAGEQGTHGLGMGDCPIGQVVVGIQYFEGGDGDWVDGIGVHCRTPSDASGVAAESFDNWLTDGKRGDEQGTHGTGMGDCPVGSGVVGIQYFEGGNDDWVDGLGVHCQ